MAVIPLFIMHKYKYTHNYKSNIQPSSDKYCHGTPSIRFFSLLQIDLRPAKDYSGRIFVNGAIVPFGKLTRLLQHRLPENFKSVRLARNIPPVDIALKVRTYEHTAHLPHV